MPGRAPYGGQLRVLIEVPDYDEGLRLATALRSAGYDIALCSGPGLEGRRRRTCSLVEYEDCAVLDSADVIVSGLGFGSPERRAVFEMLDSQRGSKPMVVLVSPSETGWLPELGEGTTALVRPARPEDVVATVTEALAAAAAAPAIA